MKTSWDSQRYSLWICGPPQNWGLQKLKNSLRGIILLVCLAFSYSILGMLSHNLCTCQSFYEGIVIYLSNKSWEGEAEPVQEQSELKHWTLPRLLLRVFWLLPVTTSLFISASCLCVLFYSCRKLWTHILLLLLPKKQKDFYFSIKK